MCNFKMAVAGALIAGVGLTATAQAAPAGLSGGTLSVIDRLNIVELVHMRGGQNYCWHEDGWNGSGWYMCGHAAHKGYGWGGPNGWQGWTAPMWGHRYGSAGHMGHHMMGGW